MAMSNHLINGKPEPQLPPQVEHATVEHSHCFSYGRCEIRNYSWSQPFSEILSLDETSCAINFAITSRPAPTSVLLLNSGIYTLPEKIDRTLVIYPGSKLKLTVPKGELRSMLCMFDIRKLEQVSGERFVWNNENSYAPPQHILPGVEWILENIQREIASNNCMREFAIESYANLLCTKLFRHLKDRQEGLQSISRGGLAPGYLRLIRERAYADTPAPTISELAALCDLTPRHLGRAFKQSTGQTLGKFIERVSIEKAFNFLRETDLSIQAIAARLGYASSTSFSYAFKRATGFRPSDIGRNNITVEPINRD